MILVTGGTGMVGSHLVRALVDDGFPVRCLVRSKAKAEKLLSGDVELVPGEISDPVALKKACKNVQQIINLVAVIREHGSETFERINVEGTLNLIVAAHDAGVKRFIHMSALGVENNYKYKYSYSKWRGEEAVRQSGLNWSILRPSVIYGAGFNFFHRLLQSCYMFPGPFVPVPGRGDTLFQPIAVQDVVRCLLMMAVKDCHMGETIEIGGPQHLSYVQMLDTLLEHVDIKKRKLYVPLFLMQLATPVLANLLRDPPVTPVELKQLEIDNITDIDAVQKYFGFAPMALASGLKQYI